MKNTWDVIHEMDMENGKPTCWWKKINHEKYGKFVWITENENGMYDVEVDRGDVFTVLVTCKTVVSAKRWVSMNIA